MKRNQMNSINKRRNKKQILQNEEILLNLDTRQEEELLQQRQDQVQNIANNQSQQKRNQINVDSDDEIELEDANLNDVQNQQLTQKQNHDKIAEILHVLLMKNKINSKNAFEIPFPNIQDLQIFKDMDGEQSWKKLTTTLESQSKIYGYRVDSLHSETYKILGGLHRTDIQDQVQNQNGEKADGDDMDENLNIQKRKNQLGKNTLESDVSKINSDMYDLEFDVDPLFQKTSATFDESGAKGLLMNNLQIDRQLRFLLDSSSTNDLLGGHQGFQDKESQYQSIKDFDQQLQLQHVFDQVLSEEIAEFRKSIQADARLIFNVKNMNEYGFSQNFDQIKIPNFQDSINYTEDQMNVINDISAVIGDESQIVTQELREEYIFDNDNDAYGDDMDILNENTMGMNPINQFQSHSDNMENYQKNSNYYEQYFNIKHIEEKLNQIGFGKNIAVLQKDSKNWMGPDIWKTQNSLNKFQTREKNKNKNEQFKKKNDIQFLFDSKEKENFNQIFKKKPKRNEKNQSSFDMSVFHSFLLPKDYHIDKNMFLSLFLQNISFSKSKESLQKDLCDDQAGEEIDEYDENENLDNMEDFQQNFTQLHLEQTPFNFENPENYQRSNIPIKELKTKIWNNIYCEIPDQNEGDQVQKKQFSFGKLYNEIPRIIGENSSKGISIQTCFITLLHLANEKALKFQNLKEMPTDFLIFSENQSERTNFQV